EILKKLQELFVHIITNNPEYLIFGAYSQIAKKMNNDLSMMEREKQPAERWQEVVLAFGHSLYPNARILREVIPRISYSCLSQIRIETEVAVPIVRRPNLGGLIASFRKIARLSNAHPKDQTFEDDFWDFGLYSTDNIAFGHFRVRWQRLNQYWNYTFTESS